MRAILSQLCGLLLRIFFRRVEVVGRHHVPSTGKVVFALNHPSGLVDPLFVLCESGRRVSFLAKAPLFSMPVIGLFVRAFECLPVYRTSDGADPAKNREMMKHAEALLARGNAIAIFPEATTHDDPTLKRFRSGAARIALASQALGKEPVALVPGALYYEQKQTFRSRAVLAFGPALALPPAELDEAGEPQRAVTLAVTRHLQLAVETILPTAQTPRGLVLAEKAERLFAAALRDSPGKCPTARALASLPAQPTLSDRMATRQRILSGYQKMVERSPGRVQILVEEIEKLGAELESAELPIDARPNSTSNVTRVRLKHALIVILLCPVALLGALVHYPAYAAVRYFAFRYSGQEMAVMATAKLVAGMLFFPLTWLLVAIVMSLTTGTWAWMLFLLSGPAVGWLTMVFFDSLSALSYQSRMVTRSNRGRLSLSYVVERRAVIAEKMAELMMEIAESTDHSFLQRPEGRLRGPGPIQAH